MKFCALIFASLLFASSAIAEPVELDASQERDAHHVFTHVMSPYCPGRLLEDCASSQASDLRDKIRSEIAAGRSSEEVISKLVEQLGAQVRAAPEAKGFGKWAWYGPAIFLVVGAALIPFLIHKRAQTESKEGARAPQESTDTTTASVEDRKRIQSLINR